MVEALYFLDLEIFDYLDLKIFMHYRTSRTEQNRTLENKWKL